MMKTIKSKKSKNERVILAPEGFIDSRYRSALRKKEISVIEIRVLSDGPVFQTIHHFPIHA